MSRRARPELGPTGPDAPVATERVDRILVARGFYDSREKAKRALMAGEVRVDGERLDKPGTSIRGDADISIESRPPFVSRGGLKLQQALDTFGIDVSGRTAIDVGASTGGFTDCLLQRGASKVYAVDVGYGQLDHRLRTDPRVVVLERTNARYLEPQQVPERCSLAVFDLSFISLHKVMPAILPLLEGGSDLVALLKPQFEGRRDQIGKGGIVRDPEVRRQILDAVAERLTGLGLEMVATIDSATLGAKGNREALAHLRLHEPERGDPA